MGACFTKTDLGRQELRSRSLPLSRTARNLLFVIDAARPATEWLGMVQGATPDDLQTLRDAGLIALQAGLVASPGEAPAFAVASAPAALSQNVTPEGALSYRQLYEEVSRFAAIIGKGNYLGMQFHPERSSAAGRKLLQNFLALTAADLA